MYIFKSKINKLMADEKCQLLLKIKNLSYKEIICTMKFTVEMEERRINNEEPIAMHGCKYHAVPHLSWILHNLDGAVEPLQVFHSLLFNLN